MKAPKYYEKENELAKMLKHIRPSDRRWVTSTERCLVTAPIMQKLLQQAHEGTHMGADAATASIGRYAIGPKMQSYADQTVKQYVICCKIILKWN